MQSEGQENTKKCVLIGTDDVDATASNEQGKTRFSSIQSPLRCWGKLRNMLTPDASRCINF